MVVHAREPELREGGAAPLLRLWLVRHGQTAANRQGIIQGQQDWPLDETGLAQARRVGAALSGARWWRAYSSDLARARVTAEAALARAAPMAETLRTDARLRECALGVLEGQPRGTSPAKARAARGAGAAAPPHERHEDLARRTAAWLDDVTADAVAAAGPAEGPLDVLVVSHSGCLVTFMTSVCCVRAPRHLHNGSITIVDVHQREAGKLVCDLSRRVNDVAHMADDPGGDMAETTSDDIAAAASLR